MKKTARRKAGSLFTMAEFAEITARLAESNVSQVYLQSLAILINAKDTNDQRTVYQSDLANIRDMMVLLVSPQGEKARLTN